MGRRGRGGERGGEEGGGEAEGRKGGIFHAVRAFDNDEVSGWRGRSVGLDGRGPQVGEEGGGRSGPSTTMR